jgi:hypothetical protein
MPPSERTHAGKPKFSCKPEEGLPQFFPDEWGGMIVLKSKGRGGVRQTPLLKNGMYARLHRFFGRVFSRHQTICARVKATWK